MFKTGPTLVSVRIHPLTRVPFSLRGIVYSRHKCCICFPSACFKPASQHSLDNYWSSADDRQFYRVKPPRPGTTTCTTTPEPALTYVRAGALVPPPPCLVEVPHGWVQVNTHSTPVLTSVRRLWVARWTETTKDRYPTTDEPDTLHKTYESRIF